MIDWEIVSGRIAPLLLLLSMALIPLSALALIAAIALLFLRRIKAAGCALATAPLLLATAWMLWQSACIARVAVVELSSPQNAFRARTIMRDGGATTSWALTVEVAQPGLVKWDWTPVFSTYQDVPAEIRWTDANTLLIRSHPSKYLRKLRDRVGEIAIQFEDCPPVDPNAPWYGVYRNGC
ncbi:MAG: hypothetical protein ABI672_06910 [Vicinamibacteria bacterium]